MFDKFTGVGVGLWLGIFCIGGVVAPLTLAFTELGIFCIFGDKAPSFAKTIFLDISTFHAKFIPEKIHVSTIPTINEIAEIMFNVAVTFSAIN